MKNFYASLVHQSVIAGEPTGYLDLSTYFYRAKTEDEVRARIKQQPSLSYVGGESENVRWELVRIMSIDECHGLTSGEEVTGFTASSDELGTLV